MGRFIWKLLNYLVFWETAVLESGGKSGTKLHAAHTPEYNVDDSEAGEFRSTTLGAACGMDGIAVCHIRQLQALNVVRIEIVTSCFHATEWCDGMRNCRRADLTCASTQRARMNGFC